MKSSPWAKLTTSIMPKMRVSPEATSARIMPVTTPLIVWISSWWKAISIPVLLCEPAPSFPRKREPRAEAPGGCPWAPASAGATMDGIGALHAQILMNHSVIHPQLGGGRVMPHEALLQDVDPPGGRQCQRHVLLDQQHRHILAMQYVD